VRRDSVIEICVSGRPDQLPSRRDYDFLPDSLRPADYRAYRERFIAVKELPYLRDGR
jgi:hypothetical protein